MKKFFQRVWQDIRTGENLDIYFTVIVCFGLVAVDIIGDIDIEHLMAAILATLAILALGSLSIRHIAKEIRNSQSNRGEKLVRNSTLSVNKERLANAKTIDWLAVTMYRTLAVNTAQVRNCLANGGKVRLILVDPESETPNVLAKIGYWRGNSDTIKKDIEATKEIVNDWKSKLKNCDVEIRYLCGQPPFRETIVDRNLSIGYSYIRIPAFPNSDDHPVLILKADEDKEWFSYFVNQFERYWETSIKIE